MAIFEEDGADFTELFDKCSTEDAGEIGLKPLFVATGGRILGGKIFPVIPGLEADGESDPFEFLLMDCKLPPCGASSFIWPNNSVTWNNIFIDKALVSLIPFNCLELAEHMPLIRLIQIVYGYRENCLTSPFRSR